MVIPQVLPMARLQVPEDSGYDEWEDQIAQQEIADWENRESLLGIEW